MVTKYGMSSRLGLVAYGDDSDEVFIGRDWGHTKNFSENVAAVIDEEVKEIIESCHSRAKALITEHKYVLEECAKQLITKEKAESSGILRQFSRKKHRIRSRGAEKYTKNNTIFCEICAHFSLDMCYYNTRKNPPNTLYSFCYTP